MRYPKYYVVNCWHITELIAYEINAFFFLRDGEWMYCSRTFVLIVVGARVCVRICCRQDEFATFDIVRIIPWIYRSAWILHKRIHHTRSDMTDMEILPSGVAPSRTTCYHVKSSCGPCKQTGSHHTTHWEPHTAPEFGRERSQLCFLYLHVCLNVEHALHFTTRF